MLSSGRQAECIDMLTVEGVRMAHAGAQVSVVINKKTPMVLLHNGVLRLSSFVRDEERMDDLVASCKTQHTTNSIRFDCALHW